MVENIELLDNLIKESIEISGVKLEDDIKSSFWSNLAGSFNIKDKVNYLGCNMEICGIKVKITKGGLSTFYKLKFLD